MSRLRSWRDARLRARIVGRRPLRYRSGAEALLDRPAHVRASSALCWVGGELVVLQDDAAFIGVVDVATALVEDVPLPAGADGRRVFDARRGNKAEKPDFELGVGAGDQLIAMGSGGLVARQQMLTWRRGEAPALIALPRLYEQLRAAVVGEANLNLEGAALLGEWVVLANRGGDGELPRCSPDALVWLRWNELQALMADPGGARLPELRVQEVELGGLTRNDGNGDREHPLRFTDLSARRDGRDGCELWYLAAAEQTTSFYDDGEVVGSALGVIEGGIGVGIEGGESARLRYAPIENERGEVGGDKVEGVCSGASADRLWAVTDPDDPERAGELLEIEITGGW
jgi:hypothetical protein